MKFIHKYLKQVIIELKKVSWPSKNQTLNHTLLVIVVSVITATYIGLADYLLQELVLALVK